MSARKKNSMDKEITQAVFYSFMVIFVLLWIVNAPLLDAQKKYFDDHYGAFKKYKLENWRLSFLDRIFHNLEIGKASTQGDDYYLDIGVGGSGSNFVITRLP